MQLIQLCQNIFNPAHPFEDKWREAVLIRSDTWLILSFFLNLFGLLLVHMMTCLFVKPNGPLARYVILRVAHAPRMPGKFSPPPRFSDPDMHHGTCVTHVPWCMSGSLTSSFLWSRPRGKTFPAFPAHAQPAILRIWQEAHFMLTIPLRTNLRKRRIKIQTFSPMTMYLKNRFHNGNHFA